MRSKEFRNGIVSQIVILLDVTCINTDTVGLFEKHDFLLWLVTSYRLSVICSAIVSVANIGFKWLVRVPCACLSRVDTVDIAQID
jgi:hypothetical protein